MGVLLVDRHNSNSEVESKDMSGGESMLLRRVPILLLAALLTASLTACGGDSPELNTPTPTANQTVPGEIETGGVEAAAQKLLADELEVDEGGLRLVSSEGMGWSDASLGCPQEGRAYAQVLTPGYKLIFDHAGTSYAVHTNIDGTNAVVCRDDSGVSAPAEATPTPEAQTQQSEPSVPVETTPTPEGGTQQAEPSAPAEATPTPKIETQNGAKLTTQGYAEALEEVISSHEDAIEDAAEKLLEEPLFSGDVLERLGSLETAESWSEEDAAFASEFAATYLRAITDFFGYTLEASRDTLDELSGLKPPEHLSDPHEGFTRAYGEVVRFTPELLANLSKNVDTRIRTQEDLADFYAFIEAADSDLLDPDLEAKGEELAEQVEEACQELQDQLEAELERSVDICE